MTSLDYIQNDYARGYVHSRSHSRKGVFVSLEFIDLCDGNMYDAILFSQIMYWHEPDKSGSTKMRRERAGHLWIAKNHNDWYDECRIKAQTARKCLDRLKQRGLIIYELHGEKGNKTPFIRINWDVFTAKMKGLDSAKKVISIPALTEQTPVISEQGVCDDITAPLLQHNEPNTENTTETTNKDSIAGEPQAEPAAQDEKPQHEKLSSDEHTQFMGLLSKSFNLHGGRSWDVYHQLRGTISDKKKKTKRYQYGQLFRDKPVNLNELRGFVKWYRTECDGCDLPIAADALEDWFGKYRAKKSQLARPGDNFFTRKLPTNIDMLTVINDEAVS